MENCVYIISGPPGVGKSAVSDELAHAFAKSAVIEGDSIYLMVRSGLVAPWEDDGYYMDLFWDNVISLTNHFLARDMAVIINYVLFEDQIQKIAAYLKSRQVNLKYCVLMAEEERLKERDLSREEIERTGDLSVRSRNDFLSKNVNQKYLLDTDYLSIKETADLIKNSDRFLV